MKKTILSLFTAFTALSANAQRHADLELTVIAPVDSQVITKGDPFDLELSSPKDYTCSRFPTRKTRFIQTRLWLNNNKEIL